MLKSLPYRGLFYFNLCYFLSNFVTLQKPNNMTPKEKVEELVKKYEDLEIYVCEHDNDGESYNSSMNMDRSDAAKCALIAAEEILSGANDVAFWESVKKELLYY